PADSAHVALAETISTLGVLTPLSITEDNDIISGPRRRNASMQAGLAEVPCVVQPYRRADEPDRFLHELREANRQRVKACDEVLREEIVSANPEMAHQALLDHRRRKSRVTDQQPVRADLQRQR